MKVAYLGFTVPHSKEWIGPGFSPAGNLAQNGFVEALVSSDAGLDEVWSFQPIASWPRAKRLFSTGGSIQLECGVSARLFFLVNLLLIRELIRYIQFSSRLICWAFRNRGHKRVLVVYNIFYPHVLFLRIMTWLCRVGLVAIIYELGEINGYKFGWRQHLGVRQLSNKLGCWCIPRLDGRILITDAIARDFAPDKHYVRVDGGITNIVSDNLFELSPHDGDEFRMMFAGGVNHWNHIQALLDFMARNRDSNLRLWIAGAGAQVKLVKDAAANDRRIVFYGQLERDALFKLYAQADVLLNLRDMGDPALAYHFPSKLLEMLVMGKPVITSSTNHAKESYGHICKVIDKIEQLDEAVGELRKMTADERCEYGKRARVWMLANKTWRAQGPTIREYLIKI